MSIIPTELRRLVTERAAARCEYCLMPQEVSIYSHEVDHIIALKDGGQTHPDNFALSCLPCNRYKGADFATLDPESGEIIPLFNPRRHIWAEHFALRDARIEGITDIGEATARLLKFNAPKRIRVRRLLIEQRRYP
ncbi:MAG TPA: HNH endonuclease [Cyanobacteria bacterium UBA11149]|nr:HNH endonuclease [Cyanobacteria bacterium UBA11367]HBE56348.1 HNH endonuclease [Cyanobacteria bacterium UBA11366]HBK65029.1 HNH endonuclease [Cyanobacteria bacterium UBA11166]HBR76249.1 HNH endonuclease [Cyanobacteria bacterium UBA11159]HBS70484.1 HNH endonuclease [Cyanobacteria bacterium UBA11153]HBW91840.1 HNH endonuclease [Cyanobacteria bacterium UBA11149]HCA94770.1 HNH endonuclease [Cyanobacteria bacterium UBA9226]